MDNESSNEVLSRYLLADTIEDIHKAFSLLLEYSQAQEVALCSAGKGLDPMTEHGDVHKLATGWLRVLNHTRRNAILDDLTRIARGETIDIPDSLNNKG